MYISSDGSNTSARITSPIIGIALPESISHIVVRAAHQNHACSHVDAKIANVVMNLVNNKDLSETPKWT